MTEHEVFLAMLPKKNRRKAKRVRRLYGAGIELPAIWLKNPGPAQWLTRHDDIHHYDVTLVTPGFKSDAATLYEIKPVGLLACPEDNLVRMKLSRRGGLRQNTQLMRIHPFKKRMRRYSLFNVVGSHKL